VSDALYERYKDALRRGHVAAMRGRLDAALVAYGEAAEIAPERALPHASIGSVLHRLGRPAEALAAYGVALERAPRDEAVLTGRAEVLVALGRRVDAADTLDRLAEVQEGTGRLAEASDTACRALGLAESKARRRQIESLVARLGEMADDAAAAAAIERAAALLEPTVVGESESPLEAEPPPDPVRLAAEAEDRLDRGDSASARELLLAAATAHRSAGELNAALDACYLALSISPANADLHLVLAELYLDRGWRGPAAEKLLLLDKLVGLGEDGASARARVRDLAAQRLPDEPRLATLRG
jgi:tetratricopeptide (TPR) repeat protein